MTTEHLPDWPSPGNVRPAIRPPDFLLPALERNHRRGGPDVYVTWGGQIYGPASVDDVINGVRTAYFEADAMFWFEGRDEWRPVGELPVIFAAGDDVPASAPPTEGIRPQWPATRSPSGSKGGERRHSGSRGRGGRSYPGQLVGRLIVIGAVLLAVLITAGLLLLISFA